MSCSVLAVKRSGTTLYKKGHGGASSLHWGNLSFTTRGQRRPSQSVTLG